MTAHNPALPVVAEEKAIQEALASFPKGWHTAFKEVREREPGVIEIGTPWEDSDSLAEVITVDTGNYYDNVAAMPMARFIAACNPEAMTALLSHLAELRAANERLALDARRYQWLREQDWFDGALCVVCNPKKAALPGFDCPSRERLDAAVDAAASLDTQDGEGTS